MYVSCTAYSQPGCRPVQNRHGNIRHQCASADIFILHFEPRSCVSCTGYPLSVQVDRMGKRSGVTRDVSSEGLVNLTNKSTSTVFASGIRRTGRITASSRLAAACGRRLQDEYHDDRQVLYPHRPVRAAASPRSSDICAPWASRRSRSALNPGRAEKQSRATDWPTEMRVSLWT